MDIQIDYTSKFIFRMIHYSNLEFILKHGLYTKNSRMKDPEYINIGDIQLIEQRQNFHVRIDPPGGDLGDYIPFYFGGHSPMLLNIKTGYRGIQKRPQDELIYIVCRIKDIIAQCPAWCFTDGHAKNKLTEFYNDIKDLTHVDWEIVSTQFWGNDEANMDRMRRKQAEFLVKDCVPVSCVAGIIVKTADREVYVKTILSRLSIEIPIYVDSKNKYFYP